jgi:hypothetical protein
MHDHAFFLMIFRWGTNNRKRGKGGDWGDGVRRFGKSVSGLVGVGIRIKIIGLKLSELHA